MKQAEAADAVSKVKAAKSALQVCHRELSCMPSYLIDTSEAAHRRRHLISHLCVMWVEESASYLLPTMPVHRPHSVSYDIPTGSRVKPFFVASLRVVLVPALQNAIDGLALAIDVEAKVTYCYLEHQPRYLPVAPPGHACGPCEPARCFWNEFCTHL